MKALKSIKRFYPVAAIFLALALVAMAFPHMATLSYSATADLGTDIANETNTAIPPLINLIFVAITLFVIGLVIGAVFSMVKFKK